MLSHILSIKYISFSYYTQKYAITVRLFLTIYIIFQICSAAYGDDGAYGYIWNRDYVKDQEGNYNTATASSTVDCYAYDNKGSCSVFATLATYAEDGHSHAYGTIGGTAGRKLLWVTYLAYLATRASWFAAHAGHWMNENGGFSWGVLAKKTC